VADDALERAVDGVADGAAVNWNALQRLARSEEERAELKWLQVLGDLANVHRTPVEDVADPSGTTQPAAVASTAVHVGEHWGRYRLVRRLGEGGFGSVYCAWDTDLERNIAIKFLREQVADDQMRQHLLREGRALAKVRHDNVVQVFGIEAHGSRVGLCMELVSGETLAGVMKTQGLLSHREAALVGEDVCRALAAVHGAGYLHRDVKAQNVMRDQTGKIVLMDFGTGHDTAGGRRRPLDVVGTPAYMAPEVLAGGAASVQSDIYSVGVLLYHLVSGQYPVEGGTLLDLIDAHRAGRRRPLLEHRPDLSMPFVQVVSRALAADPAQRWPSAGAMLEALGDLRESTSDGTRTWARVIARVAAATVGTVLGLVALGMISSRYFNVVMGREAFVREGPVDWLYWGWASAFAPAVLVLMVLIGASILRVAVKVVLGLSPAARRAADALPQTVHRLGLADVETLSALALVGSIAVLGIAVWLLLSDVAILLSLFNPNIATAPLEVWQYLSPSNGARHETYRLGFEWACLIAAALWMVPFRMAARQGRRPSGGILLAGGAVLLLGVLLLDFPYRLLYQAELETVRWHGERCYLLGERSDDALLLCPDSAPPRTRAVRKDDSALERLGTRLNPFSHASPSPEERP
jgi:RIO-like serine/threonine protein kinase